ncbi:hypothetical protein J6894_04597 [Nakaseomyces glabratus]|nr:hypothetical protein J6894_04597 [Nakaseomyces glabratus]
MFFDKCASVGTLSKFRIFVIGSLDEAGAPSHSVCMFHRQGHQRTAAMVPQPLAEI